MGVTYCSTQYAHKQGWIESSIRMIFRMCPGQHQNNITNQRVPGVDTTAYKSSSEATYFSHNLSLSPTSIVRCVQEFALIYNI